MKQSENQAEELLKKRNEKLNNWVHWILICALILIVIYAQVDGRFIHNKLEVIEICDGEPVNNGDQLILDEDGQVIDAIKNNNTKSVLGKYQQKE